jgi:hypothetical protein
LGNQIKEEEMDQPHGTYGEKEKYVQGFGWETYRKETIWKPVSRLWKDNIKMDLKDTGWDWVNMAQDIDKL